MKKELQIRTNEWSAFFRCVFRHVRCSRTYSTHEGSKEVPGTRQSRLNRKSVSRRSSLQQVK